jgi:tyrosine-protein phosphatase SIW14
VTLALLTGSLVVWNNYIKDYVVIRNFGVVEAGHIYRSGRLTGPTLEKLHAQYPVKTIIDLGAYEPGSAQCSTEESFAARNGIERDVYRLYGDGTGNPNAYVAALRVLTDPARHPVLVHCSAGAQRTSVTVMLYRMIYQNVSLEDAYAEAQRYGHDPSENDRLLVYVKHWRGPIEAALKAGGDIPGIPPPQADRADTADSIANTR